MSLPPSLFAYRKAIKFIVLSTVVCCAAILGLFYYVAVPAGEQPKALEINFVVLALLGTGGGSLLSLSHLFAIMREDEDDDGMRPFIESLVPITLMFLSIGLQYYVFRYHGVKLLGAEF